jgi:hypothetical protein
LRRHRPGRAPGDLLSLIVTRQQAGALYGGNVPADVLVLIDPPARWPPGKLWPPKVTLPAAPCWRCVTGPLLVSPLARHLLEKR